ncbi:MAG TPA: glycosyltransferase [Vicinamibacterales bacterium]|jgi:glycosyltransferase involved in cell wall biosynthesis|nr:glycosyltransferase [Vicinamibacterales bacterium]
MQLSATPRVALFTDSYVEANGVARTATALEAFAWRRDRPLLIVHGGDTTQVVESGSVVRLELARSRRTSFNLEHDLRYDLALWRHRRRLSKVLRWFRPDVLHFTGPSDVGQLGAFAGYRQRIPMVGSWHTNLHEYASRRLLASFDSFSNRTRLRVGSAVERHALSLTMLFYSLPKVMLAPNEEWRQIIETRTRKPTFVMTRGVDTTLFTAARRNRADAAVNIGYVGRLSAEKNVRALAALQDALWAAGIVETRFTIVGDGAEREWLRTRLPAAEFTGVIRGERLADAYANLDLFVFPSETETVGNVVLEAMASGVPVVAMARGGTRFIAASTHAALLAQSEAEFVNFAVRLVRDRAQRETMAAAARETSLTRSWDAVFDVVYRAYDVAIAQASRDRQPLAGARTPVPAKQSA